MQKISTAGHHSNLKLENHNCICQIKDMPLITNQILVHESMVMEDDHFYYIVDDNVVDDDDDDEHGDNDDDDDDDDDDDKNMVKVIYGLFGRG